MSSMSDLKEAIARDLHEDWGRRYPTASIVLSLWDHMDRALPDTFDAYRRAMQQEDNEEEVWLYMMSPRTAEDPPEPEGTK